MFGKSNKRPLNPDQLEITTIIGEDCQFVGNIISKNSLRLEGNVQGNVTVGKGIVVGENGSINGNVVVESAIIYGKIYGNLTSKHLEIKSTGFIQGEVETDFLQIEMGGVYNGKLEMKKGNLPENKKPNNPELKNGNDLYTNKSESVSQVVEFGAKVNKF